MDIEVVLDFKQISANFGGPGYTFCYSVKLF